MFVGAPLLMGSYFGIIPGFVMTIFLAIMTAGEEKMMQVELDGYEDYKKKVKSRFIPFIW